MVPAQPPVFLDSQVILEVQHEIGRRHRPSCEEMGRHPALFKVIGRISVSKDVNEELAPRTQSPRHLGHEGLVILHVLKHLEIYVSARGQHESRRDELTSIETTRSKLSGSNSYVATSPVTTSRFFTPFSAACSSINAFCFFELEKATTLAPGNFSA
jgi:hypothetical protein